MGTLVLRQELLARPSLLSPHRQSSHHVSTHMTGVHVTWGSCGCSSELLVGLWDAYAPRGA